MRFCAIGAVGQEVRGLLPFFPFASSANPFGLLVGVLGFFVLEIYEGAASVDAEDGDH